MTAIEGTLEHWATCDPGRVAVIDGERQLTYGEWNDLADRLADQLDAIGLRAGDRVGLRAHVRAEWFIVHRALGKLGVEGVAVNWRLTAPEAEYILADSGAIGLICDDTDVDPWRAIELDHLLTMGHAPTTDANAPARVEDLISAGRPVPRFGPVRPPLVLYTSGTTGKPKGVPPLDPTTADMERVNRYYASVLGNPELPPAPRVLLTLPVHHAAGPFYANAACQRGGVVVLLDRFDPERAASLIEQHRLNAWTAVPTMLLRLKALGDALDAYDLTSIEVLNLGAAAVPHALKEWAVERFGEGVLWESYGCSEAGMLTYASPADQLARPGTSGRPFDEVTIRIVDDAWDDVGVGAIGEIAVATPVAIDRYLGRPAMGADQRRDGIYRTGDVGRVDSDGYLYITDRVKDMIVAGGVNIYPAEVEAALVQHPDIVDSAVIGVPHDEFGEEVMAFVVVRPGSEPTLDNVRAFLAAKLARYKLPRVMRIVAELPMNPAGKVTKNELRAQFWADRGRMV